MNRISRWWKAERVNRIEAGTSQDMCPRNGDVVVMWLWFMLAWTPLILYFALAKP